MAVMKRQKMIIRNQYVCACNLRLDTMSFSDKVATSGDYKSVFAGSIIAIYDGKHRKDKGQSYHF